MGCRFLVAGDFNAKHIYWGSRLIQPKGRNLLSAMESLELNYISVGEPTYWPSDPNKIPDLIDFGIIKGLNKNLIEAKSILELSSDHSPILFTINSKYLNKEKSCILFNKKTNWIEFRKIVVASLNNSLFLKTNEDIITAIEHFNNCIQQAAWQATPAPSSSETTITCSKNVLDMLAKKRSLRKQLQKIRYPPLKTKLNKVTKDLKNLLDKERNLGIQDYLLNLEASRDGLFSLEGHKEVKASATHIPTNIVKRRNLGKVRQRQS